MDRILPLDFKAEQSVDAHVRWAGLLPRRGPAKDRALRSATAGFSGKARWRPKLAKAETKLSKNDLILRLLRRKRGAALAELQAATGWQAHSVRGFLSAKVKRDFGMPIQVISSARGPRRYVVAGA